MTLGLSDHFIKYILNYHMVSTGITDPKFFYDINKTQYSLKAAPIFIVGCGHSGTSLLLQLLSTHPAIYGIKDESRLFVNRKEIEPRTVEEVFNFWNYETLLHKKNRWIEKTPLHVYHIAEIFAKLPSAKIVIMTRNGKDTICSLKHRYGSFDQSVTRWVKDNDAWLTILDGPLNLGLGTSKPLLTKYGKEVYLLKYEDLVESPRQTMKSLINWIDEEDIDLSKAYEQYDRWYMGPQKDVSLMELKNKARIDHEDHSLLRAKQLSMPIYDGRDRWKTDMKDHELYRYYHDREIMRISYLLGYERFEAWNSGQKRLLISCDDNDYNNINGPSLIKVPNWIQKPLGKYYLYFAHHAGKYIRMATSNDILGPYTIYQPGTLHLNETLNGGDHIASPDVHIDQERKKIIMYFHSPTSDGDQSTFIAESNDGTTFECTSPIPVGKYYFRVFHHDNQTYAVAKNKINTILYKKDIKGNFIKIEEILPDSRHLGVFTVKNRIFLFYSKIGDIPESIYVSELRLDPGISISETSLVLVPDQEFEGNKCELQASLPGAVYGLHRQVRDPYIYSEDNRIYMIYAVGGENGLGIVELFNGNLL